VTLTTSPVSTPISAPGVPKWRMPSRTESAFAFAFAFAHKNPVPFDVEPGFLSCETALSMQPKCLPRRRRRGGHLNGNDGADLLDVAKQIELADAYTAAQRRSIK